ncbi:hypothetical protein GJ688_10150 [Heliobacillus mobilis]|uniref:Stage III sporulation protein AG n=1 Tax=Heliobacterium mobile TaxID=28064 RepID=A0A6I3SKB1_HELMO|nr:hypothetical protein [Heliobacterium mobile]MTV49339.1 hypothetical protein [Heliobacterium mobile]
MMELLKQPKDKVMAALAVALFFGIALMSMDDGKSLWSDKKAAPTTASTSTEGLQVNRGSELAAQEKILGDRVASALSKISGVGTTEVVVSLSQGTQSEYAINTNANDKKVEEKDKQGGTRVTTDKTDTRSVVVMKEGGAVKELPVVVREMRYQVAGVLVVAEGAKDPNIKQNVARAVCTLLDIPPHKVSVFPKEDIK